MNNHPTPFRHSGVIMKAGDHLNHQFLQNPKLVGLFLLQDSSEGQLESFCRKFVQTLPIKSSLQLVNTLSLYTPEYDCTGLSGAFRWKGNIKASMPIWLIYRGAWIGSWAIWTLWNQAVQDGCHIDFFKNLKGQASSDPKILISNETCMPGKQSASGCKELISPAYSLESGLLLDCDSTDNVTYVEGRNEFFKLKLVINSRSQIKISSMRSGG